jgi:hypothetical protein
MFFEDTFTGTTGTNLSAHTPDTGTGWTQIAGNDWKIDNNRTAPNANFDRYKIDDAPDNADYDVQADYVQIGTTVTTDPGIMARYVDASNHLIVKSTSDGVKLEQADGGVFTNKGSWTGASWANGVSHTVRLELRGTTAKVYVDGVEEISATVTITAQGDIGLHAGNTATYGIDGIKLDNFSVSNPPAVPNPPSGVTMLRLSWTDNTGGTASHRIYFRTTAGPGAWTLAMTTPPGVTETPVWMDNSTPRVAHDYAVAAVSGGSESNLVLAVGAQARVTHTPLTES